MPIVMAVTMDTQLVETQKFSVSLFSSFLSSITTMSEKATSIASALGSWLGGFVAHLLAILLAPVVERLRERLSPPPAPSPALAVQIEALTVEVRLLHHELARLRAFLRRNDDLALYEVTVWAAARRRR